MVLVNQLMTLRLRSAASSVRSALVDQAMRQPRDAESGECCASRLSSMYACVRGEYLYQCIANFVTRLDPLCLCSNNSDEQIQRTTGCDERVTIDNPEQVL